MHNKMELIFLQIFFTFIITVSCVPAGYPRGPTNGKTDGGDVPNMKYLPAGGNDNDDGGGGGMGSGEPPIEIIKCEYKLNYDGSYTYEYETANGIQAQEMGYVKNKGIKGAEAHVKEGSFSYTSPEGQPFVVSYVADENGYQPQGEHLPTPPPIPPEIQEVLDKIAEGGGCPGCDGHEDEETDEMPSNGGYVY